MSRSKTISPPYGGWNARDPKAKMAENDAVILDNIFPGDGDVDVRRGYTEHITGLGGIVKTLAEYESGTTNHMLACANGAIQEVSGASATSLATGLTNDEFNPFMFSNILFMPNGTDSMRQYNGSAISTSTFTGVTLANLVAGLSFKGRPFFVEKDTQKFWYPSSVGAVTGALTSFDLSQVGNFGGNLHSLTALTLDAGDGVDDLLCCIMTSGEVLIYKGTDPGSDFSMVGVFKIGSPITRRGSTRLGGDTIVVSKDGYLPLSAALQVGRSNDTVNVSDKIRNAVNEAARDYSANDGWDIVHYPQGNMLIINIPVSTGVYYQHVMNTNTGAWCRFKGINARCFTVFNDDLYFGDENGKVFKADNGGSDDGTAIMADAKTAFTYLSSKGKRKKINVVKLLLRASAGASVTFDLNMDYEDVSVSGNLTTPSVPDVFRLGVSRLGAGKLGGALLVQEYSELAAAFGYALSIRFSASVNGQRLIWEDSTVIYEEGAAI